MFRMMILLVVTGCAPAFAQTADALQPRVYRLEAGNNLQYRLQELLVKAVPGDAIEFAEGKFHFTRQIDIATDNITLRGKGSDQTILSFKGQLSGGQGIEATGNNLLIEGLAVEDTSGNAIKVLRARNVTFRDVRAEWTGEAKSTNGAYGLYPVLCRNVLIDSCVAIGASDAGIYVGQSREVVVRGCRAERNVAGIEIENTVNADVYDNVATNNAGGLLVFDLPGLQLKAGRNVRVFRNRVVTNNHRNFAAPGNIVASVSSGTGLMIMATDQVEVFDNDIKNNKTANVAIVSYLTSGKKIKDKTYNPFCKTFSIHDNRISGGGKEPSGEFGNVLGQALGTPLPDILFDGAIDPSSLVDGRLPKSKQSSIINNGEATFVNFKLLDMSPENIKEGKYKPSRNLSPYAIRRPSIAETRLADHDPPAATVDTAVLAYRRAPKLLSGYGLFEGKPTAQQPAKGVFRYELNTPLFSDYAAKYRFIKIPSGSSIQYRDHGILDFPDGTVIAKTFAYRVKQAPHEQREQLLETRIELLHDGEWFGYSYQWNEDQADATLLLGGGVMEVSFIDGSGATVSNRYEIPNANQCLNCHSQNKEYVPIGTTARNMNRHFKLGDANENQLDYLATRHWLSDLVDRDERQRLPVFDDPETGSLDARARAWLHVNCAHCHSPLGTAGTSGLDLRYSQSDPSKFGVWKSPVAAGHGSGGRAYDIVPGEPDKSIMVYRMESQDPSIRMPSVGRNLVPREAVELIREWITAMPKEK